MNTSIRWFLLLVLSLLYVSSAPAVYDPRMGRWLSRDPIGEDGGFNLYAYCGNDPVNKHDPLGLAVSVTGAERKYLERFFGVGNIEFNEVGKDSYNVRLISGADQHLQKYISETNGSLKYGRYLTEAISDAAFNYSSLDAFNNAYTSGEHAAAGRFVNLPNRGYVYIKNGRIDHSKTMASFDQSHIIAKGYAEEWAMMAAGEGVGQLVGRGYKAWRGWRAAGELEAGAQTSRTFPPGEGWVAQEMQQQMQAAAKGVTPEVYRMSLPTKITPSGTPSGAWEIANTGGKNYMLEGGGVQFWADGVNGERDSRGQVYRQPGPESFCCRIQCARFH